MSTTSQAIAKRDEGPQALIEKYRDDFAMVLPSHVQASQWVRLSQGLLRRNQPLATAATRNPGSFLAALLDCARLGLEPGDTYHLVPFGNEVTGIVDYTGEIELAYRSGAVSSIVAEIVYSLDSFSWTPGQMDRPQHAPNWFGERGQMIGAYAYAVMKDGATSRVVVMSEAEINAVRAVSKTANRSDSPWKKWPDRMWLKTVVHQLAKWIPTSAEYRQQVLKSEAAVAEVTLVHDLPAMPPDHETTTADLDDEIVDAEIVDETEGDAARPAATPSAPAAGTPVDPADTPPGSDVGPGSSPAAGTTADEVTLAADRMPTQAQLDTVKRLIRTRRNAAGPQVPKVLSSLVGRKVQGLGELTYADACHVIETLEAEPEATPDDAA